MTKSRLFLALTLFATLSMSASAAGYVYLRSINTYSAPLGIAVDVNPTSTTCYYATFGDGSGGGPSDVVMVRDFLASTGPSDQTVIDSGVPFYAAGLRGFQGISVDSAGNVYASGDNSGGSQSSYFKKYVPNGNKTVWTADGAFAPSTSVRFSGCAVVNDSMLVVPVTNAAPEFISTADGSLLGTLPANQNYGREATYNSNNEDIYIAHNGSNTTASLTVYNGGNPTTTTLYVKDTDAALGGGINTTYGTGTQCNGYNPATHELIHCNNLTHSVEIYNVDTSQRGAAAILTPPDQVISSAGVTTFSDVADAVSVKINGVDYLLVTSTGSSKIYVFVRRDSWQLVTGPIASVYDLGDATLSAKVSATDLLEGVVGTVSSGGWHSAYTGDATPLTNGVFDANNVTALANDYGLTSPSLVLDYPMAYATINRIDIFAGHDGDGSRAFINCKVSVDTGSGYAQLGDDMVTGPFGTPLPGDTTVSDVVKYDPAGLATGVVGIRFAFYGVSNSFNGGFFAAPGPDAINGTILKEIDVFGTEAPAAVKDWQLY